MRKFKIIEYNFDQQRVQDQLSLMETQGWDVVSVSHCPSNVDLYTVTYKARETEEQKFGRLAQEASDSR